MQPETSDLLDNDDKTAIAFLFDVSNLDSIKCIMQDEPKDDDSDSSLYDFIGINAKQFVDLFFSSSDDELMEDAPQRQTRRGREQNRDPQNSAFGIIVDNTDVNKQTSTHIWDETCILGKKFRRRYRLPYILFDRICKAYEESGTNKRNPTDAFGRPKSNTRYLILGVLQYLAQVIPFDFLEELSQISGQKNHQFFHKFVTWFSSMNADLRENI